VPNFGDTLSLKAPPERQGSARTFFLATMAPRSNNGARRGAHSLSLYLCSLSHSLTHSVERSALPWRRGWRHQITGAARGGDVTLLYLSSRRCVTCREDECRLPWQPTWPRCRPAQFSAGLHQVLHSPDARSDVRMPQVWVSLGMWE
jgi:hypothetical protein